jgi:hypothetical protein
MERRNIIMKSQSAKRLAGCLSMLVLSLPAMFGGTIAPTYNPGTGNVTWGYPATGLDPKINPITADLPPGGSLSFYWTDGDDLDPITGSRVHLTHPAPGYGSLLLADDDPSQKGGKVTFNAPAGAQPPITDYHLELTGAGFRQGAVTVGALQNNGSWIFVPLNSLQSSAYVIPGLAGLTPIYAAVNLSTYEQNNPLGPLNGQYISGDSLDSLGMSIVNGTIPGLAGIYFATSPFGFDPASATGFVPIDGDVALLNSATYEALNGPITILGTISATSQSPEPASLPLFVVGSLLIATGRRVRRRLR